MGFKVVLTFQRGKGDTSKPSAEHRRGGVNWLLLAPRQRTVPFIGRGEQSIRKVGINHQVVGLVYIEIISEGYIVVVNDTFTIWQL